MSRNTQFNRNRSPTKAAPRRIGYNDKAKTVKPSALPKPVHNGSTYHKKTFNYDDDDDDYRTTRRAKSAEYIHTHKKYDYDSGRGSSPDHRKGRGGNAPSYARMTVAAQNKLHQSAQHNSLHSQQPSRSNSHHPSRSNSHHPSRSNSQHNLHSHHPSRSNSQQRTSRARRYSDSSDDMPVGGAGRRYARNARDSSSDSDSIPAYKKKPTHKYSRTNSSSDDDSIKGSAYRRNNVSKYSRNQSPPNTYNRRGNQPQLRRSNSEDSLAYTQRISRFNKGYHGDTWTTANQAYGNAKNTGVRKAVGNFDDARYRTNGKMTRVHH